ncbi:hypothetical protein EDC04DRAFT_348566 [Pisolithus marmoratus]|nr:hypothetical protein EDC04DRAFT_348566 [Pisolithus marmoratus]
MPSSYRNIRNGNIPISTVSLLEWATCWSWMLVIVVHSRTTLQFALSDRMDFRPRLVPFILGMYGLLITGLHWL